ncbi:hypothetical protein SK128_027181, partial [Halocaridina rubra]
VPVIDSDPETVEKSESLGDMCVNGSDTDDTVIYSPAKRIFSEDEDKKNLTSVMYNTDAQSSVTSATASSGRKRPIDEDFSFHKKQCLEEPGPC